MAINSEKEYNKAREELEKFSAKYEALRTQESSQSGGSTREELKSMMQPLNDLRDEIDAYEIQHGMRPEGAFVTVKEIR